MSVKEELPMTFKELPLTVELMYKIVEKREIRREKARQVWNWIYKFRDTDFFKIVSKNGESVSLGYYDKMTIQIHADHVSTNTGYSCIRYTDLELFTKSCDEIGLLYDTIYTYDIYSKIANTY